MNVWLVALNGALLAMIVRLYTPPLPAAVDHVCASCGDPLGSALIKIAAPWGPAA